MAGGGGQIARPTQLSLHVGRERSMSNDDSNLTALQRIERRLDSSEASESILNIFKAGLATAPFCGGIASLISDYIPSARFRRLEEFAAKTAEDLNALADRVNETYVQSDDFAFIFEKCFRGAAENPQEEKLSAFRAILVNSTIRDDVSEQEKEYFLNLVNSLTVVHIRILQFMANPSSYLETACISESEIRGGFRDFFPVAIPGIAMDVIHSAFGDLHRFGLIKSDQSVFATMTSSQGLRLLGDRVSDFGKRFLTFCTTST